jgi:hypothetical protein
MHGLDYKLIYFNQENWKEENAWIIGWGRGGGILAQEEVGYDYVCWVNLAQDSVKHWWKNCDSMSQGDWS